MVMPMPVTIILLPMSYIPIWTFSAYSPAWTRGGLMLRKYTLRVNLI